MTPDNLRPPLLQLQGVSKTYRLPRRQPGGKEFARGSNRIDVAGLPRLHGLHGILEMQKAGAQRSQARAGLFGQFQALAGPAEQDDAEEILQRADLLPDRSRCNRQLIRSPREREVPCGGIEDAQGVEGQVRALHGASLCPAATGGNEVPVAARKSNSKGSACKASVNLRWQVQPAGRTESGP